MESGHAKANGVACSPTKKTKAEKSKIVHSNGTSNGASNGLGQNGDQHYFLTKLFDMMLTNGLDKANDRNNKIVEFKHPKELEQMLDLDITKPTSDDRLLSACEDVIKYSVKTGKSLVYNSFSS